jgi:branched-chain amino acid transport system substrate-binding protein
VVAVTLLVSCAKQPVKVGVAMVLTGLNSEIGVTGRNGAELAAESINAAGGVRGRPIELIVRDDKGDPDVAEEIDAKLAEEGVVAIVGHMASSLGLKAIPAATSHELPLISPTISSSAYSRKDDYFFRVIGENSLQGKALAAYAYNLGLRRVAAAYEWTNRAYTAEVYLSFRDEFERRGGMVADAATFSTFVGFDYGPTLVRLLAFKPDGLLSVAGPADNAALCALLEKRGSTLPVLAGMWSMTGDLIQLGGRSADRMIVAGTMDPASDTGAFRDFDRAYRERYGTSPSFSSVHSYEAVRLLASALEKSPSWRGADLKKAILTLGRIEGLQDDFTFDRFGDADRPYKIFRVIDGRFARVR